MPHHSGPGGESIGVQRAQSCFDVRRVSDAGMFGGLGRDDDAFEVPPRTAQSDEKHPRRSTKFSSIFNLMFRVCSFRAKMLLSFFQKLCFSLRVSPRHEGRIAIVTAREV